MGKPRSQSAKDATIRTFSRRALLLRDAERYRNTLQTIVDVYDMRSELFTSDEDLAANLCDRARIALKTRCEACSGSGEVVKGSASGDPQDEYAIACPECGGSGRV